MWFHTNKVARITQRRHDRLVFAEELTNSIARLEFYATNRRRLDDVVQSAKHEDELYEEYLGEPMPEHMRRAITLELSFWLTLHELLARPAVTEDAYPALCRKLRPYLGLLVDLLHAEEEMMTSPLTRHYHDLTAAITADAVRVQP